MISSASRRAPLLLVDGGDPTVLRRVVGSEAAIELRARVDGLAEGQVVSLVVVFNRAYTGPVLFCVPAPHEPSATVAPSLGEGWSVSYFPRCAEFSLTYC